MPRTYVAAYPCLQIYEMLFFRAAEIQTHLCEPIALYRVSHDSSVG